MADSITTIVSHLESYAPLNAILGNRIYPHKKGMGQTLPAVTYLVVSNVPTYGIEGRTNIHSPYLQFDIYADSYGAVREVSALIKDAMDALDTNATLHATVLDERDRSISEIPQYWIQLDIQFIFIDSN